MMGVSLVLTDTLSKEVSWFQHMLIDQKRDSWEREVQIGAKSMFERTNEPINSGIPLLVTRANEKVFLSSNFFMDELTQSLDGYNSWNTKSEMRNYLNGTGDKTISVKEQINTIVCDFMKIEKLGHVKADATEEKQCKAAKDRLCRMLVMICKHMFALKVNNNICISNSFVLSRLEIVRNTRVHNLLVKKTVTSADALRKIMSQIQNEKTAGLVCTSGSTRIALSLLTMQ